MLWDCVIGRKISSQLRSTIEDFSEHEHVLNLPVICTYACVRFSQRVLPLALGIFVDI